MDMMKHTLLLLLLLVATPVFANPDCRTIANDVANQDQILKTQSQEFTDRYGENNGPDKAVRQEYLARLDALINALRSDINGLRWLIDHHCGPAREEPNALRSVHAMESILVALLVRKMDARAWR